MQVHLHQFHGVVMWFKGFIRDFTISGFNFKVAIVSLIAFFFNYIEQTKIQMEKVFLSKKVLLHLFPLCVSYIF